MSSALYCNFTLIVLVGDVEDSCTMLPICLIDKFNHDICWGCFYVFDGSLFISKNWTFLFGQMVCILCRKPVC